MRILVTGGAGFIGSHVVDAYVRAGHEVAVVDSLVTGCSKNIHPQAAFYQADIRDADGLARIFTEFKPQIVNHHAAQVDVRKSTENPLVDAEINILGSLHLLRAALAHGVDKVIYASSGGAVYGEPEYLPADERHPVRPICEYGISKYTVEQYLYAYALNYQLNYTVLRYANVYGPRQNVHGEAGVVAIFSGKMLDGEQPTIYGTGEAVRDYVYVSDVARANVLALSSADRTAVNIATSVGTAVNTLYHLLAESTGYTGQPAYAPARVGEIACTYLDNRYAAEILDWCPVVDLATGIQRTVESLQAQA